MHIFSPVEPGILFQLHIFYVSWGEEWEGWVVCVCFPSGDPLVCWDSGPGTSWLNHPECWETFYIALFKSGWFFLRCFLTTFCLGLHLQWLSVLSLGSHFCQLLKCLVLVGAETGARRKWEGIRTEHVFFAFLPSIGLQKGDRMNAYSVKQQLDIDIIKIWRVLCFV